MALPPLYKYLDVEGAKLTLRNGNFKHAKPSEFNDLEDLTIRSIFPESDEAALQEIKDNFTDVLLNNLDRTPTCPNLRMRQQITLIQNVYRENPHAAKVIKEITKNDSISKLYDLDDRIAEGSICNLDLEPIQEALKENYLLHPSSKFSQLLTGSYQRADSMLSMMRLKPASNPHFIESLSSAVVCRWVSLSEDAVEKKARDIMKRLSDANDQLPSDVSGIAHIGFEALGADAIEQRRYEKIIETARRFDRGSSGLEVIYCHYFAPDPAPDEVWAIDETVQWIGRGPLEDGRLLPSDSAGRSGVHWIKPA